MQNKTLTLLGFAAKAGKLAYGADASLISLKKKKSYLIIVACDLSEKSRKEINFYAEKYNVKVITLTVDKETLSKAVGRKCGIISVNEKGFAMSIIKINLF